MTNPFNRADKHGAPDIRPTAPPSAETPMRPPTVANVQFMTAAEQVEHGHRTRGEPTYAELQAITADLFVALLNMLSWHGTIEENQLCWCSGCSAARTSVAKAKIACG